MLVAFFGFSCVSVVFLFFVLRFDLCFVVCDF